MMTFIFMENEETPVIGFKDLGLDKTTLSAIEKKGFKVPSPIQILAIPRLLGGEANVIARARTGTGKTAAFGLPLVQKLRERNGRVRALILEPTRELAVQTAKEMQSFTEEAIPHTTVVYGGASMGKSEEIIAQLENMYTKMLESTEERINSQNDSAQKKIKQLVDEIERASNDNRARQSDMVLRMQNDENDLQTRLGELNKEIKNVASQMSVFEKAENMKQQLEEEIDSLSEGFDKLEGFKVAADAFQGQFDALCNMNDEAEKRLEKFNTARKQIDSLEKDFSKIIAMSGSMDEKIRELQSTSDDLQTMEVKVRNFQETLAGISISYERLDKKAEVIERVSNDVDKSFETVLSYIRWIKTIIQWKK